MDQSYQRVLRQNRVILMRELPAVAVLLDTLQLKQHFSTYEKSQILSQSVPAEKAAKFLDTLEFKSYDVYVKFLAVIRELRPDLALRLDGGQREADASSTASSPVSNGSPPYVGSECVGNGLEERRYGDLVEPMEEEGRRGYEMRVPPVMNGAIMNGAEEDAGPYGLSGCGPGPAHHLSHLSYEGREFLAENLNGNPPERNVFHSFCHALGVDNRLARVSARSPNPTAYLIQEYSAKPEATFDRLEQALAQIGKRDVFEGLWMRMQSGY